MDRISLRCGVVTVAALGGAMLVAAQQTAAKPEDTEVWKPVPKVVTPGNVVETAPSDATVLFDGKGLGEWVSAENGGPANWIVANDMMTVNKQPGAEGAGSIETKRRFRNYQLHLEWKVPTNITGSGQARGNSGVFLASTGRGDAGYELQILDSYNNSTYVNGMAASLYKQSIPMANPARKPGEWQSYDVVWTAPVFNADGSLKSPAFATVLFNGVLVDNHFQLAGETLYIGKPFYKAYGPVVNGAPDGSAPIKLQAHGDKSEPISFRNIWVRELP